MSKPVQKNKSNKNAPLPKNRSNKNGAALTQSVTAPVAAFRSMNYRAPSFKNTEKSVMISHKELIGNISSSATTAQLGSTSINPGLPNVFPWLSIISQGYEKYKFHSLRFYYLTRCGTYTNGEFAFAVDFDPQDSLPNSENAFTSYAGVVATAAWKDVTLEVRSPLVKQERFIRSTLIPGTDIKTYDVGNLITCLTDSGTSTYTPWGKLWAEYTVELINPQLTNAVSTTQAVFASYLNGTSLFGSTIVNGINPAIGSVTGSYNIASSINNGFTAVGLFPGNIYQLTLLSIGTGLSYFNVSSIQGISPTINVTSVSNGQSNSAGTQSMCTVTFQAKSTLGTVNFVSQTGSTWTYTEIAFSNLGTTSLW
jgi:hypothetical protein